MRESGYNDGNTTKHLQNTRRESLERKVYLLILQISFDDVFVDLLYDFSFFYK